MPMRTEDCRRSAPASSPRRTLSGRPGDTEAWRRHVCRELWPAVEPLRRGARPGRRGNVSGQEGVAPADLAASSCLMVVAVVVAIPVWPAAMGLGFSALASCSAAVDKAASPCAGLPECSHSPGRPSRSALARCRFRPGLLDRRAPSHARPAPGVRPGRPDSQALADAWLGSTARTRRPRNGSTRACGDASQPGSPRFNSCGLGVLGGVPIVNRTLNKVANFSGHPDWTLRVCDNFDWYAPG